MGASLLGRVPSSSSLSNSSLEEEPSISPVSADTVLRRKTGGGLSRSQRLSELSAVAGGSPSGPALTDKVNRKVFHSAAW